MIPAKYNITIYKGGTWSITIEAEEAIAGGVDFSTDYTDMQMQIRRSWKSTTEEHSGSALMELTIANGRITVAEDGSSITLTISAADTAGITFKAGTYDLELINSNVSPTVIDKLLYGTVTVIGEVTI